MTDSVISLVLAKKASAMIIWTCCVCRDIKVSKKAKIRNQVPHLTQAPHGKVTKTQENITYKSAKRYALSQQVTTRLQ